MPFKRAEAAKLLAACHRRCCICHRFCGVKMELDHIEPRSEEGPDSIENAIPVCFECHAEIHSYNPKHPRGRRFRPEELRNHKKQWLSVCQDRPELLISASREIDVGPLQALIDELEFNRNVAEAADDLEIGCPFRDDQFKRTIRSGSIAVLQEELKAELIKAYGGMGEADVIRAGAVNMAFGSHPWKTSCRQAARLSREAAGHISKVLELLQVFLA